MLHHSADPHRQRPGRLRGAALLAPALRAPRDQGHPPQPRHVGPRHDARLALVAQDAALLHRRARGLVTASRRWTPDRATRSIEPGARRCTGGTSTGSPAPWGRCRSGSPRRRSSSPLRSATARPQRPGDRLPALAAGAPRRAEAGHPGPLRRAGDGPAPQLRPGRLRHHPRAGRRARGQGGRAPGVPVALRADGHPGRGLGRGLATRPRASSAAGRSASAASTGSFVGSCSATPSSAARRPSTWCCSTSSPPRRRPYPDFVATKKLFGRRRGLPDDAGEGGAPAVPPRSRGRARPGAAHLQPHGLRRAREEGLPAPVRLHRRPRRDLVLAPQLVLDLVASSRCPTIDTRRSRARASLSELDRVPDDLERYVLKPLFSFAGAGVVIDVTPDDVARIPAEQRSGWLLQERSPTPRRSGPPTGRGEGRGAVMMFLRAPAAPHSSPSSTSCGSRAGRCSGSIRTGGWNGWGRPSGSGAP